jgi:hypothetical protein
VNHAGWVDDIKDICDVKGNLLDVVEEACEWVKSQQLE